MGLMDARLSPSFKLMFVSKPDATLLFSGLWEKSAEVTESQSILACLDTMVTRCERLSPQQHARPFQVQVKWALSRFSLDDLLNQLILLIKTNMYSSNVKNKLNWLFDYTVPLEDIHVGWDWKKTNIPRICKGCRHLYRKITKDAIFKVTNINSKKIY